MNDENNFILEFFLNSERSNYVSGNFSFPQRNLYVMEKKNHLRKQELLSFIKRNVGKISQREIARRLEIGKTTINRWTKEIGFTHKKHTVNEQFFDFWSEQSAYILGYIYADGNIAWNPEKGYQSLTITAAAKDKEHLEIIRNYVECSKPLLHSEKTNSYRLIANSKKWVTKLMELGVYPNKSLTISFPNFISEQCLPHFIRGIIDGDGNVRYVQRKRSPYFEITIASGSFEFCRGLIEAIRSKCGIDANARKVGKNTLVIQYSCSRGERLAHFLYSNATIYMKRKYNEYKTFLEVRKNGK